MSVGPVTAAVSECSEYEGISGGGNTLLEAIVHGDGKSGNAHERFSYRC